MGSFNISAPLLTIGSTLGSESPLSSSVPFQTTYLEDPWTLSSLSTSDEDPRTTKMDMLLSVVEIAYQATLDPAVDFSSPSSSRTKEEDTFALPSWVVALSHSHDCFDDVFPFYEAILEAMNGLGRPWEDLHHHSYFLLELERVECDDFRAILSEKVGSLAIPLGTYGIYVEGDMENLSLNIPINIS